MNWLTIKQVADQMQVSTGTVRAMIESGRLSAVLVGAGVARKTYRIPVESMESIKQIPEPKKEQPAGIQLGRKLNPAIAKAMGL